MSKKLKTLRVGQIFYNDGIGYIIMKKERINTGTDIFGEVMFTEVALCQTLVNQRIERIFPLELKVEA